MTPTPPLLPPRPQQAHPTHPTQPKSPEFQPDDRSESDEHQEQAGIKRLEDLEVDEFLRRSSKYLQKVSIRPSSHQDLKSHPGLPDLSQFQTAEGSCDWINFSYSYLAVVLEKLCPFSLKYRYAPTQTSLAQIRAHAERAYLQTTPDLWLGSLVVHLSDLYRWKDFEKTTRYCAIYFALWLFDLIPSFIVAYALYLLIKFQIRPPSLSQLKQELKRRQQLSHRASTLGLAYPQLPDLNPEVIPSSLTTCASLLIGENPLDRSSHHFTLYPSKALYTLIRQVYAQYGHLIQTYSEDLADLTEKIRNLYLWRRPSACWRTTFMMIVILLYNLSISQKWVLKNFLGWLGIEFFFVFGFVEKYPQFRRALNPVWLLFYDIPTNREFALQILQERGISYQVLIDKNMLKKKSNRVSLQPPSNQSELSSLTRPSSFMSLESARTISHQSSLSSSSASLYGSSSPTSQSFSSRSSRPTMTSIKTAFEADNLKRVGTKFLQGSHQAIKVAKHIYDKGEKKLLSTRSPESNVDPNFLQNNQVGKDGDLFGTISKTFAVLDKKTPGILYLKPNAIWFKPIKGFRHGKQFLSTLEDQMDAINVKGLEDIEEEFSDDQKKDFGIKDNLLKLKVREIVAIQKIKWLGFKGIIGGDGIELNLHNSTTLKFDKVLNRDEIFHQILTIWSCTALKLAPDSILFDHTFL
ncbi:hypothetical protein O181_008069 [Austropuccinia psidii MF-1]|uniref:Uncharacterized protein n=1 Tax=Austropuccinia psidii MF-1 TaxID=1389203 RepID=A0A9Q3GII0_9BASI|nr:hypothetical protein [Austropuccinia psidii MF-1]